MTDKLKKNRNVIAVTGAVVGFAAVVGGTIFMTRTTEGPGLPAAYAGASVAPAPDRLSSDSMLKNDPAYLAMQQKAEQQRGAEAKTEGQSYQTPVNDMPIGRKDDMLINPMQSQQQQAQTAPMDPALAQQRQQLQQQQAQQQAQQQTKVEQATNENAMKIFATLSERMAKPGTPELVVFSSFARQGTSGNAANASTSQPTNGQVQYAPVGGAIASSPQSATPGATNASSQSGPNAADTVLIQAGDLACATVYNALNTDMPGPVRATITCGPYVGATMLGQVTRQDVVAKLEFNTLSIPSRLKVVGAGNTVKISAIALDADTVTTGVASNVDRHVFAKYVVRPTAAALSSLAKAITQRGTQTTATMTAQTTYTTPLTGAEQAAVAAGAAADAFAKDAESMSTNPTVTVNANTMVGIMFLQDVVLVKKQ